MTNTAIGDCPRPLYGLVVLSVAQFVAKTERGELRDEFRRLPGRASTSLLHVVDVRRKRPSVLSGRQGVPRGYRDRHRWQGVHVPVCRRTGHASTRSLPSRGHSRSLRKVDGIPVGEYFSGLTVVAPRVCSTGIGGVTQCRCLDLWGARPGSDAQQDRGRVAPSRSVPANLQFSPRLIALEAVDVIGST